MHLLFKSSMRINEQVMRCSLVCHFGQDVLSSRNQQLKVCVKFRHCVLEVYYSLKNWNSFCNVCSVEGPDPVACCCSKSTDSGRDKEAGEEGNISSFLGSEVCEELKNWVYWVWVFSWWCRPYWRRTGQSSSHSVQYTQVLFLDSGLKRAFTSEELWYYSRCSNKKLQKWGGWVKRRMGWKMAVGTSLFR